jgi:hypothetical protein
MYIFICFEILNILVIDKNFCKRGGNVTECLVMKSPPGGFHQTSPLREFPVLGPPAPYINYCYPRVATATPIVEL